MNDDIRGGKNRVFITACVVLGFIFAFSIVFYFKDQIIPLDAETLYEKALNEVETQRFDEAEKTLVLLRNTREQTPLDHGLAARVAIARNRNDEALQELSAIPDDHGLASWARLRRGQLLRLQFRFRDAEAQFRAAIQIDPKLPEPRRELVYILGMQLRRGELNQEFQSLARLTTLSPKEVWVWCMVRDLAWWIPEEQIPVLEKALVADPDDDYSRLALAEVFRRSSMPEKALAELDQVKVLKTAALARKAEFLIERDGPEAAVGLLKSVPELDPAASPIRGRISLASGDANSAIKQLEIANQLEPGRREIISNLARAFALSGDKEQSRELTALAGRIDALSNLLLKSEKTVDSSGPDQWRALAQACDDAGRPHEARAWLSLLIQKNPLDQEAQTRIFRLDEKIKQ